MTAPEELKYWVALNRIAGLGRVRYSLLQNHFPSMEEAWRAGVSDLNAAGLDSKLAARVVAERAAISPDEEMERLASSGITALTWQDPAYPPRLKEIYDLPPVLYVRGRLTAAAGARRAGAGDNRARRPGERLPTGYGAPRRILPAAQPDHVRPQHGRARRGGGREQRRQDHRPPGAGAGPRCVRR